MQAHDQQKQAAQEPCQTLAFSVRCDAAAAADLWSTSEVEVLPIPGYFPFWTSILIENLFSWKYLLIQYFFCKL